MADAKMTLEALLPALAGYKTAYTGEIAAAKAEWEAIVDDYYTKELPGGLNQTLALGIINEFMPNDAIALALPVLCPGICSVCSVPRTGAPTHGVRLLQYGL